MFVLGDSGIEQCYIEYYKKIINIEVQNKYIYVIIWLFIKIKIMLTNKLNNENIIEPMSVIADTLCYVGTLCVYA